VTNASLTTTFYTDSSVTNGTMFYYVVSAVNSGGEGPNSSQVFALPVSLSPPQLIFGVSGGQIQISWPADHLGWTLQVQTNDLSTGLGTNWISIPDSATNTQSPRRSRRKIHGILPADPPVKSEHISRWTTRIDPPAAQF